MYSLGQECALGYSYFSFLRQFMQMKDTANHLIDYFIYPYWLFWERWPLKNANTKLKIQK